AFSKRLFAKLFWGRGRAARGRGEIGSDAWLLRVRRTTGRAETEPVARRRPRARGPVRRRPRLRIPGSPLPWRLPRRPGRRRVGASGTTGGACPFAWSRRVLSTPPPAAV